MSGRLPGSSNKRTDEGRAFARAVLLQDDVEMMVIAGAPVDVAAGANPVLRRLREQARMGVGTQEGCLPPNVFVHLADRLYGKVMDRVKLALGGKRPYEELTDAQLAERASLTASWASKVKELTNGQ